MAAHAPLRGDIAIIGMACLFPGAPGLGAYWRNIVGKVDAIGDPPEDWWSGAAPATQGAADEIYCQRGGYLGDLARFNPMEYGIMPNSIDGADPDQFLALRVAHEALADAGYVNRALPRERTEVVLGRGAYINRGYGNLMQQGQVLEQTMRILSSLLPERSAEDLAVIRRELKASLPPFSAETAAGLVPNIVSGRIANRMDYMGPSFTVDAACASALVALEIAVRDLLTHRCDAAVVGGVQASTPPPIHTIFCTLGALSRKNQIRPFDRGADGTMLGEGVGVVVLKRREDAERDGDRIYAIVKGVGTASDGRALGVLAPRLDGEVLAVRRAYEQSGVAPHTIGLIEAHGTATPVGDATEIQALRAVFGERAGAPSCALGSVKSMIGHTLPAAGVAGLIKVALALHHKVLPPTLHCEEPDPRLELDRTPFYLNGETRPWIHGGLEAPRRAGVNAFGFGGINAHVVLEEYTGPRSTKTVAIPDLPAPVHLHDEWDSELLVVAADSRDDLIARAETLLRRFGGPSGVALKDVAYTLNVGEARPDAAARLAIVATSVADARDKLAHAVERLRDPACRRIKERSGIYFFSEPLGGRGKVAFLFPGEGSQYLNMLADLCVHFPEVRASFDLIDRAFADHVRGYLPSQLIFPAPGGGQAAGEAAEERLWQMDAGAEAVFVASHALHELLRRLEIRPDAVVGHSTGEYSALLAAGAVVVQDDTEFMDRIRNLNAIYERLAHEGRIPTAVLVAVGAADPSLIASVVEASEGALSIAMDNCRHQVVLCGPAPVATAAMERLRADGAICNVLPMDRAYHTARFGEVADAIRRFFGQLTIRTPQVDLYSCVTARPYPADPDAIRDLGVAQWTHTVRFRETIAAMHAAGVRFFIEVGPRNNLTGFVDDILRGAPYVAVASNVPYRSGITQLHHLLALLAAHGVPMRLDALYARRATRLVDLAGGPTASAATARGLRLSLGLPAITVGAGGHARREASASLARPPVLAAEATPAPPSVPSAPLPARVPPSPSTSPSVAASSGAGIGRAATPAMQAYLKTMNDFLQTQEDVMRTYLLRARRPQPAVATPTIPPATPPALPVPTAEARAAISAPAVASDRSAAVPAPGAPTVSAAPAAGSTAARPLDIARALLSIVSDKTGYPTEMLDVSAQLEADLGIDSIKRVEVLGAFQREHGLVESGDMETLSRLKTLHEIIEFLRARGAASAGPDPASLTTASTVAHANGHAGARPRADTTSPVKGPFIGEIVSLVQGKELVARRHIDVEQHDLFLQDHTLGGRVSAADPSLRALPVMPLTMSMEILAEAAAILEPDRRVIEIREVRAHRWMAFDEGQLTVQIVARRRTSDEIRAEVREAAADGREGAPAGPPILEATIVFAARYPDPPHAEPLVLRGERPSTWSGDRLYGEAMFHGPRLQGVASMDRWGEDGAQATLQALPADRLFATDASPTLLTDPVVLDAAGQVIGYWTAEHLATGFHVFPYRVDAVRFYGPGLEAPERATCQARIALVGDAQVRSTIDVVDQQGRVRIRLVGWEDRRFEIPASFYRLRIEPRNALLAEPWTRPVETAPDPTAVTCCRVTGYSEAFLEASGRIWRRVLAHLVLGARERATWATLRRAEPARNQWLLGRAAAKDAVRLLVKQRYGVTLYPADIEIAQDEHGRPVARGPWADDLPAVPVVSIAHVDGVAVAVAADPAVHAAVGVDVETLRRASEDFVRIAFTGDERELLAAAPATARMEWALRGWCAKEAVAKALGRGMMGHPHNLVIQRLAPTGRIDVLPSRRLAEEIPSDAPIVAHTIREDDLIVALSFTERGEVR